MQRRAAKVESCPSESGPVVVLRAKEWGEEIGDTSTLEND
jgi:hypothetical protein